MGKRIEVEQYRPKRERVAPLPKLERELVKVALEVHKAREDQNELEAYKAAERAKVAARVRRYRAKKAGK